MSTLQHFGSPSIASMVAGFPRGPRIAFAPDTGAGSGKSDDKKDDAAKKDGAKPDAAPKADGAKKDEGASGGEDKMDRLLSMMDSIAKAQADAVAKIDATNARVDAMQAKTDAAKADASKKDEMSQPSKEERETSGRQSEEENGQERERDKAGVGDAAKKDSSKKDEDDDKDKDEDKKRDDKAKADAVDPARYEREMADIRAKLPRTLTDAEELAFATTQAKADSLCNLHGRRAPAPMFGETLMAYRLRLAGEHQKFSPTWKGKDLRRMAAADPSAYDVIEGMIYNDSAVAANNPIDLGAGELRRVKRYDEGMMRDVFEYKGRSTYVKNLSPVAQRFDGFKVSPRAA